MVIIKIRKFKNLENLEKNYESLMIGDILEGKLYKEHVYEVTEYIGYSTSLSIARNLELLENINILKKLT